MFISTEVLPLVFLLGCYQVDHINLKFLLYSSHSDVLVISTHLLLQLLVLNTPQGVEKGTVVGNSLLETPCKALRTLFVDKRYINDIFDFKKIFLRQNSKKSQALPSSPPRPF